MRVLGHPQKNHLDLPCQGNLSYFKNLCRPTMVCLHSFPPSLFTFSLDPTNFRFFFLFLLDIKQSHNLEKKVKKIQGAYKKTTPKQTKLEMKPIGQLQKSLYTKA